MQPSSNDRRATPSGQYSYNRVRRMFAHCNRRYVPASLVWIRWDKQGACQAMIKPVQYIPCLFFCSLATSSLAGAADVAIQDSPGDHLDVLIDGKVATPYMYAYDKSTPER